MRRLNQMSNFSRIFDWINRIFDWTRIVLKDVAFFNWFSPRILDALNSAIRFSACKMLRLNRALLLFPFVLDDTKERTICSDERLTLETSTLEFLYGGQFILSPQSIKANYLEIFPNNAALHFFRNLSFAIKRPLSRKWILDALKGLVF